MRERGEGRNPSPGRDVRPAAVEASDVSEEGVVEVEDVEDANDERRRKAEDDP